MCVECNKIEENNIFKNEIQELSIHTILKVHNGKQIDFICGSCNIEGTSNKQSLIKSKSCGKCHNSLQRKDYEILKKEIENMGFTLVTKQYEYTNNKNITVLCICKNEWKCSLNDLSRGRKCMACKTERTYETNNIKYGCDNVFQNEKIKEISKQTLQQNFGVDYPQQSAKIREKTTETSLQRYGVKRAFCLPEVYEKIQNTHFEKYGVRFPLQSKIIQEKIDETFLSLCGKKRPFGTEYHEQIILKKYGNTIFVCTEYFKEQMMEKYGSEYFINSDEFKEQMIETYGFEHAMYSDQLFKKMIKNRFIQQEYIFEDGTKTMILGYEDLTIKELEESKLYTIIESGDSDNIPTFWYDFESKQHKYYPDIYLPEKNTIIEVKSVYYFNRDMEKNIAKAKKVVSDNYIFFVYVYNSRNTSKIIYKLKDTFDEFEIYIEELYEK